MLIKTPTAFSLFNDGKLLIFSTKKGKIGDLKCKKHYGITTTTYKRYYAAKTAGVSIDLVVHIARTDDISPDDTVIIKTGAKKGRYSIVQLQQVELSNPRTTVLSLKKIGMVT